MMSQRRSAGARISSALLALVLIAQWFALPTTRAVAQAPDLESRATILRDEYGVPHIQATSEEAAALAHGYAIAEDHAAELAKLFLRARGELASEFGESYVNQDLMNRELRIWDEAQEHIGDLPPLMQRILNAYAGGYNLYLSRHREAVPQWAKPVTGVDVLAHCRAVLLLDFSLDLRPWLRAGPQQAMGSNMWAIGRERSHSGRGLLLANPHLPWSGSHIFYEVQITVPGRINICGATLLGFPVVTIGFNDYLGWSHTVNQHDSDDVYELTLNPDNPSEYMYDDRPLPLKERTISVLVKTAKGIETRSRKVLSSHYGPVISVTGNKAKTYKSANLKLINFLVEYNQMAKATSLAEFRAALNMMELPMFNIAYTDREGNVFFVSNSRIPIRPGKYDWAGTLPGDTSKTEWYSVHPLSELPQLLNPRGGYVQNCNDAPWYANLQESIDRSKFPDYLRGDGLGGRGTVSLEMLENEKDWTLDKVMSAKFNERLLLAERLKPELISLVEARQDSSADLKQAAEVLKRWDNSTAAKSRGAILFIDWWAEYSRGFRTPFKTDWSPERPLTTPAGLGDPDRALVALARVVAQMKASYGDLAVEWGKVRRLQRGSKDLPIGGWNGTFRAIGYLRDDKGKWIANFGDSYVLAVEFTTPPTAYSVMAYSESSDPRSKHFDDQTELFAQERFKPLWFTQEDIRRHLERAYHPGD